MGFARSRFAASLVAAALAGPLFLLSAGVASLYMELPRPLIIDPSVLAQFAAILIPAILLGAFLGLGPILLANFILGSLAERFSLAREAQVWWIAGAACGAGLAGIFGTWPNSPQVTFALVFTSAVCAGICHAGAERDR